MDEKKIYGGLGILAAIMLLAAFLLPRDKGPDVKDLIAKEVAPLSDAVTDLGGRVDAFEGSLGDISEQLANAVTAEDVAEVSARVDEALAQTGSMSDGIADVSARVDEALAQTGSMRDGIADVSARVDEALAQTGALSDSVSEMKTTLDETGQAVAAATVAQVSEEVATAEPVQAAESGGAPGVTPGETAIFADGALRLFVSRLDEEAQEVRVSNMGEMTMLAAGQGRTMAVGDDYCRVTVVSVTDGGAEFDTVCGDDLPAPEGISAGRTAVFADGALRVFASLVLEEEARLSIDGDMFAVALGRSVPVMVGEEACRVYLDALDRGHAMISAKCGAEVAVSDFAGPGSTVMLNEGAVRVFVGSVREGTVRFSVNGQTLVSGVSGDSQDIGGGCAVVVEDVADGQANFSHACDG